MKRLPGRRLLVAFVLTAMCTTAASPPAARAAGHDTCRTGRIATAKGCERPGAVSRRLGRIVLQAKKDYGLKAVITRVDVGSRSLMRAAIGRSQTDVAADPRMNFRIGSMAIPWLTTMVLQLQQEDRLDLDDKLSRWFPDFPRADQITLRMLATSTSGYHDYLQGNPEFIDRFHGDVFKRWRQSELLDIAFARGFVCDPGTCFSYAHTNFILLGLVVQKATGQTVAKQMTTRILRPLRLDDTRISSKAAIPDPVLHAFTSERGVYEDSTTWSPSWTLGDGAIATSTIDDIATAGPAIFSGRLLSRGSYRELVATPRVPPNTKAMHYGLGLLVSNDWRIQNPSLNGYSGVLAYLPAAKLSVALTTTSTAAGSLIERNANEALFARLAAYLAPDNATPYAP
jgi:D-alanyl-D-alanine carboxypeptidase